MGILILYHSKTGNTERLAREISEGAALVPGATVTVKSVAEVTREDFLDAEGIIAGSPVYFGTMAAELKKVFDDFIGVRKKMENKVGAAFATSAHHTGGKETTIMSILQAFLIYGMIVAGDPMSASGHYGVAFNGKMDEKTADHARKLGERVARLCEATRGLRSMG